MKQKSRTGKVKPPQPRKGKKYFTEGVNRRSYVPSIPAPNDIKWTFMLLADKEKSASDKFDQLMNSSEENSELFFKETTKSFVESENISSRGESENILSEVTWDHLSPEVNALPTTDDFLLSLQTRRKKSVSNKNCSNKDDNHNEITAETVYIEEDNNNQISKRSIFVRKDLQVIKFSDDPKHLKIDRCNNNQVKKKVLFVNETKLNRNTNSQNKNISDEVNHTMVLEDFQKKLDSIGTLRNIGNSCYLNSVLYTLCFVPLFLQNLHQQVEQMNKFGMIETSNCVLKLHDVYCLMHQHKLVPNSIILDLLQCIQKVNPIFSSYSQQDAHELLLCMLNILDENCRSLQQENILFSIKSNLSNCCREYFDKKFNFIDANFRGVAVFHTLCKLCKHISQKKQPILDIPLNVLKLCSEKNTKFIFENTCLANEVINDENNRFFCHHCNALSDAEYFTRYEKLPSIIIFHLKRFSSSFNKIVNYSITPTEFDCFCDECLNLEIRLHKYSLIAVIMHTGLNTSSGHYTTYARDLTMLSDYDDCCAVSRSLFSGEQFPFFQCCSIEYKNKDRGNSTWYFCDDDKVETLTAAEFQNRLSSALYQATPYVLLYTKTNKK